MSGTLLAFAKPLLAQIEDPPTVKSLQAIMNIAVVVWNLHVYEKTKHPMAREVRGSLDAALTMMPAQSRTTIAAMTKARATTYVDDPRLGFAEVVTDSSGKAEVRATAFLLDRPPNSS